VFPEVLRQKLGGIVSLTPQQVEALYTHYELLLRWNRSLNLTTVTALGEAIERHYCESLFLGAHLPLGSLNIVDIGSGPGFPGFVVGVSRPECAVTLVESHQRKAVFLREASRGLANVQVKAVRAEAVHEEFDYAISRAVSYEDLSPTLKKLGRAAALLTGADEPPERLGFGWDAPIALPWGKSRFLRFGVRKGRA
jgi:16S rRNA (guanine527-N7)-methyltransferase